MRFEDRNTPSVAKPYRRIGASAAILAILSALLPPIAPAQAACNTAGATTTCSGNMSGTFGPPASSDYLFDSTTVWTGFGVTDGFTPPPTSMTFQTGSSVSGTLRTFEDNDPVTVTVEQGATANVHWQIQQDWTFDVAGTTGPIDTANASGHAVVTVSGTVTNAGAASTVAAIGGHTTVLPANFSRMTGSVDILSGGLVESTNSSDAIFMRGSGVSVTNAGTITGSVHLGNNAFLRNDNVLTGNALLDIGTIENNGTLTGNATVGDASSITNTGTIGGNVTTGAVSAVSNSNTITGNVTVGASAQITNNGSIGGDVTIGNAGRLTHQGSIGGSIIMGSGGNVSLTTGTTVGGTVSTTGSATNRLRLLGTGSNAFDLNKLSGFNRVNKEDSGTWTLTGTSADTAAWNISDGALVLNGSVSGSMTVGTSAQLRGNATLNGDMTNSGSLVPGNSIGTLTVNGNLTLNGVSNYQLEIAGTQSDRIVVNGAAALDGALDIRALGSSFGFSTPYTILSATGGITGTFSSVADDSAFLDPNVTYNANDVRLTMTRNAVSFADVVQGGAPGSIAQLFDNLGVGVTGDMVNIFNAIFSLSVPEAQNAFTQLSGVTLTAPNAAIMAGAAKFDSVLLRNAARAPGLTGASFADRMGFADASDAFGTTGLTEAPGYLGFSGGDFAKIGQLMDGNGPMLAAAPMEGDSGAGFWVSGYGIGGSVRGDDSAPGFVYRGGGVLSGADYRWSDETLVGLALGYGASKIDHQNSSDEGRIGSIQASLYALQTPKGYDGRLKLDGALGIARHSIEADRHLTFGGLDRTASSDHEAYELSARAGLRYAVATGTPWLVEPTTSLAYSKTYEDGYTETGAAAANLTVADDESDSFISRLGARVTRSYQDEAQRLWQPEASFAWRHEFADTTRTMDAAFAGIASPFRVQGSQADRDALEIGLGVNLLTADAVSYALNYSATLSDNETGHGLFGTVRFAW